jgi:hypothetical protein
VGSNPTPSANRAKSPAEERFLARANGLEALPPERQRTSANVSSGGMSFPRHSPGVGLMELMGLEPATSWGDRGTTLASRRHRMRPYRTGCGAATALPRGVLPPEQRVAPAAATRVIPSSRRTPDRARSRLASSAASVSRDQRVWLPSTIGRRSCGPTTRRPSTSSASTSWSMLSKLCSPSRAYWHQGLTSPRKERVLATAARIPDVRK